MQKDIQAFEKGERIEGFYLIKALNLKTSSNNNKYLDMILGDRTAEINAKLWDVDEVSEQQYKVGDVMKVRGDVTLWMEQLQLKIIKARPLEEGDDIDFEQLVPASPIAPDQLLDFLKSKLQAMKNDDLRRLCEYAVLQNEEKLLYYPAAMKNHHAIRGGLLYHLYRMMISGEFLSELYGLNWDLVLAGIVLHDLDKLSEMDSNELGIVSGYTTEGILLGHIVSGVTKVHTWGLELGIDPEVVMLVKHMILSHHYEADFGSPKKPMFAEAELLHHLDMMDARMYDMEKAKSETAAGQFSDPVFSLDRRRVYHSTLKE